MAVTVRGKAVVEGVAGAFDLIAYPVQQTGKMEMGADEEIIKDAHGASMSWLWRDLHYFSDWAFKLVGDTAADAAAGAVFIAPGAAVTLSTFAVAALNGTWQNTSQQSIDLGNTKVGDLNTRFRKYDDPTQNTLATTTPA